jgi:ribosomal protein L40E
MKCPRCAARDSPQGQLCRACGTTFSARCTKCGTELSSEAGFCFSCGEPARGCCRRTSVWRHESYNPKHLAERILTSKTALERTFN